MGGGGKTGGGGPKLVGLPQEKEIERRREGGSLNGTVFPAA